MPDDLHPHLQPTADPSKVAEPPTTVDAAADLLTFERHISSLASDAGTPHIPGYAITGELARGGMGVVFAATDRTLEREVAIKTLLPGAPAERFVTESKIAARLPHPGIPPVHALGWLDDGSPYLAMKLIRGRALSDLLKQRSAPSEGASKFIAIFEQIALAVGFAHEQGIIHRDLKPLNVMVGAFGEVQVMDWGLAKDLSVSRATHQRAPAAVAADDLIHTSAGAIMGTPGYMSPEQARGEPADARADVFALGAILAAILTGKPAFVGTTARETIEKAARGDLSETLERLAASGADAELVALAAECLAAELPRRPADAKSVAQRVGEYRQGVERRLQQAETAKAEALVREAEQSKRRRAMQRAAGIVTVVLLAGVVGTSLGWNEALRQTGVAKFEAGEKGKALEQSEAHLKQAKKNLAFAKKGNAILGSVFEGMKPERIAESRRPLQDVLRDNLVRAVKQLEGESIGDEEDVAAMQNTLGASLFRLGDYGQATTLFRKALAARTALFGPDDPATLTSLNDYAAAVWIKGDAKGAVPLFEDVLKRREARLGLGHPDTLASMHSLAQVRLDLGDLKAAEALFDKAFKLMTAHLGEDHPSTLAGALGLAQCRHVSGRLDLALPLYEQSFNATKAKLGPNHPDSLTSMTSLALAYREAGKAELALPLYEEAWKIDKASLGFDHPQSLSSTIGYAQTLKAVGKADQATPLLEEAATLCRSKLGRGHPLTLNAVTALAGAHHDASRWDRSMPLFEECVELYAGKFGRDHPDTLTAMNNLALAYQDAGKTDMALSQTQAILKARKAKLGAEHPETLQSMNNLASLYQDVGKLEQAIPLYREAVAGIEKLQFMHQDASAFVRNAAAAMESAQLYDEAAGWRRKWMAVLKDAEGSTSAAYAAELASLGGNLLSQRKLTECQAAMEECLSIRQKLQPDAWTTFNTQSFLGAALLGQKKYAEAEPLLLKGYEGMKQREKTIPPQAATRIPEALDRLIELYTATNKPDEVKKWKTERAKYSAAKAAEKK